MHYIGLSGVPRRYYTNEAFPLFDALQDINVSISLFAFLGGAAQVIFFVNFFYSVFRGSKAKQNPWGSNALEWTTPINAGHGNWPGPIPTVHRWAYDYSKPGAEEDFIPQNVPLKEGEEEVH
jgi:cytochrome c oxidase subunit 1